MEFKKHLISKEQAQILQKEFITTRGNTINKILNKEGQIKGEDCRDFWFSIDVLKEFISKVEKQAQEKGQSKGLGIRIFSGAYPKNESVKDAGYATLFLMAGYENDSKITKQKEVNEKSSESEEELILNFGAGGIPPVKI